MASNVSTAVETETFSESIFPCIGILIRFVELCDDMPGTTIFSHQKTQLTNISHKYQEALWFSKPRFLIFSYNNNY